MQTCGKSLNISSSEARDWTPCQELGKQATRQEATPGLDQIDQSEDSIKQNTTYTSHLLFTVSLLEGDPGSANKVHNQQSCTLYSWTGTEITLYLHTGAMMRDFTVDSQRYLLVNRSSAHLSPIGSHLHHFMKPLTCIEDDHAYHDHHLVSDFCLLSPALHCNTYIS